MPHQLTRLVIKEVSIVDDPANPHAQVSIVKARGAFETCPECKTKDKCAELKKCGAQMRKTNLNDGDPPMTPEQIAELQKQVETLTANVKALEKRATDAEGKAAAQDKLIKAKDEAMAELEKKLNPPSEEDVMKSLPEGVRHMIEKQRKELDAQKKLNDENAQALAKMAEEREEREWIGKAAGMKLAHGKADDLGPVLMRVAKGKSTEEDAAALQTLLKALSAQASSDKNVRSLFGKSGSDRDGDVQPMTRIDSKAAEYQKADPKLSKEQAISKALEANPDLYDEYEASRSAA